MSAIDVVFCHPIRTPIGTYGGSLKATPATVLGAAVIRETLRRSQLSSEKKVGPLPTAILSAPRVPSSPHVFCAYSTPTQPHITIETLHL